MLAANGSIFTILAISFERYYAICKPLKAGYKCTRLRATIIICLIWILSTILTSPILIMAKSSETIYIDGSLVYNCILETDGYWHKMYVFVSMIAFFCLPLIVLMLVYWLIGRRLIRENLAMSTTTSLATNDSAIHEPSSTSDSNGGGGGAGSCHFGSTYCHNNGTGLNHGSCHNNHHHSPASSAIYVVRKRVGGGLRKASSLKSISASLFSLLQQQQHQQHHHNHDQNYHQISLKQQQQQETKSSGAFVSNATPHKASDGDQQQQQRQRKQLDRAHPVCKGSMLPGSAANGGGMVANHHLVLRERDDDPSPQTDGLGPHSHSHKTNLAPPYRVANDGHHDGCGGDGDDNDGCCVSPNCNDTDLARVPLDKPKGERTIRADEGGRVCGKQPIRRSLANQFVYHLFHINLIKQPRGGLENGRERAQAKQEQQTAQDDDDVDVHLDKSGCSGVRRFFGCKPNHHHHQQDNGGTLETLERSTINEMPNVGGYPPAPPPAPGNLELGHDGSRTPFIARGGSLKLRDNDGPHCHRNHERSNGFNQGVSSPTNELRGQIKTKKAPSRFYWAKRFSVSSSSASMQTNCTYLTSEPGSSAAVAVASATGGSGGGIDATNLPTDTCSVNNTTTSSPSVQISPRPIIHNNGPTSAGSGTAATATGNSPGPDNGAAACGASQRTHLQQTFASGAKKSAHFSIDTRDNSSPTPPPTTCSSASESSASTSTTSSSSSSSSSNTYSLKTPSPTEPSLFDTNQHPAPAARGHLHQINGTTGSGSHVISRKNSGSSSSRGSKTPSPHQYPSLQTTKNASTVEEEPEEEVEVEQPLALELDVESGLLPPPPRESAHGVELRANYHAIVGGGENFSSSIKDHPDESQTLKLNPEEGQEETGPISSQAEATFSPPASLSKQNSATSVRAGESSGRAKATGAKVPIRKGISLDHKPRNPAHHHTFHFNLKRASTRCGTQSSICGHHHHNHHHHYNCNNQARSGTQHLSELLVVQDISKKQQMDSRRQVVVMLAFVVACFFLLFFPYRVFTIWLILSTEDQVQSLGMETYYNLTYFSRILIYLHSAINPIAYNLISTKFRRAFMSILLCRGSSTRRHFITEHHQRITTANTSINNKLLHNGNNGTYNSKKTPQQQQLNHIQSN